MKLYAHLQGGWPGLWGDEMKELKVKRLNLNVEVSLHDAFKAATAAHGVNMTDVIMEFIQNYVAKNGLEPKKKARR
jgi:hypothetical protein